MQGSEGISEFRASEKDLEEIANLMRIEDGNRMASPQYLHWWYFDNPSQQFSFWAARGAGRICAMATMNAFPFIVGGESRLIGMPQKVLTARSFQGKGLFGKLYLRTEKEILDRGADSLLTFTNAASTPIFLNKFHYARGLCPDLIWIPPNPLNFFAGSSFRRVDDFHAGFFARGILQFENAAIKDISYYRWRYKFLNPSQYEILEIGGQASEILGFVFLKRIRRAGVPLYLLMDLAVQASSQIPLALSQAAIFCCRRLSAGLILFENTESAPWIKATLHKKIHNRFNFLVKGSNAAITTTLAKTRFNFFFGDLDFT